MDLVIMAAGMGSRFGGLKQVEPINDNNEFILDYSIYDAIQAGFDSVVFIIKEENYDLFRRTVGKRIESKIKVQYVFQDMKNIPKGIVVPESRKKPLGTGHAIYCLNGIVKDKFAVINADDFYGRQAFEDLYVFMKNCEDDKTFASINYPIESTLTQNGTVKRGVCIVKDGEIQRICESKIENEDGKICAYPLSGEEKFVVDGNNPVAVNMFALTPYLFDYLNKRFESYLKENKDNLDSCEYLLPSVMAEMMVKKMIKLVSINTTAKWHGVTYKEDKEKLQKYIKSQTEAGVYPSQLWK